MFAENVFLNHICELFASNRDCQETLNVLCEKLSEGISNREIICYGFKKRETGTGCQDALTQKWAPITSPYWFGCCHHLWRESFQSVTLQWDISHIKSRSMTVDIMRLAAHSRLLMDVQKHFTTPFIPGLWKSRSSKPCILWMNILDFYYRQAVSFRHCFTRSICGYERSPSFVPCTINTIHLKYCWKKCTLAT